MDKTKILVFLRVSTEQQEIEAQRKEMFAFCKSIGYSEKNIVTLEEKGASAIKQNEKYLEMLDEVKGYVERKEISAVAVWAVNRLARNEETFFKMKQLFIDNKIQFYVKNPSLTLLNEDGTVNTGSELALSLFATMSKQDMLEKKAKFKRSKLENGKKGKYMGGHTIRYGYRVDANGFFAIDEKQGEAVRMLYELYSTGKYSSYDVMMELVSRGVMEKSTTSFVGKILANSVYCGIPDKKHNDRVYPAIVSKELFDKCAEVRQTNRMIERGAKDKVVLGSKLLRCPVCGSLMTCQNNLYRCCKHSKSCNFACPNTFTMNVEFAHKLLWRVASGCHIDYIMDLNENKIQEYQGQVDVLMQKISVVDGKLAKMDDKRKRIVDSYVEGLIDKAERDKKLEAVEKDSKLFKDELLGYKENVERLKALMNCSPEIEDVIIKSRDEYDDSTATAQQKYDIIHKHILKMVPERQQLGDEDKSKRKKPNGILVSIYTVSGETHEYFYFPRTYKGCHLYVKGENGEWVQDKLEMKTDKRSGEEKLMDAIKNI